MQNFDPELTLNPDDTEENKTKKKILKTERKKIIQDIIYVISGEDINPNAKLSNNSGQTG